MAAFAAAAVALTPLAAVATEKGNIMPERNRAEDSAARAFMDSKGEDAQDEVPDMQDEQRQRC